MIIKSKMRALLAGALFCAAGIVTAQALPSTFVTFSVDMSTNILLGTFNPGSDVICVSGTFNSWGANVPLVQLGSSTVYSTTLNDTTDTNGGAMQYTFRFTNSTATTYEQLPTHINGTVNRQVILPTTSGASLVLPTCYFADAGAIVTSQVKFQLDLAQQFATGNFNPLWASNICLRGTILGNFNNPNAEVPPVYQLTNDPTIITIDNLGVSHSNVYVGTWPVTNSPGAMVEFKFTYDQGGTSWESPQGVNKDGGGNRYFANVSQTLPIVLWSDQGAAYPCTNVFQVDMSGPAANDPTYDPTSVRLAGSFNNWSKDIPMTNNINAGNTNLFTTSLPVVVGQGSTIAGYQFKYNDSGGPVYDHAPNGQNRTVTVPNQPNFLVPWVYFNNVGGSDSLLQPMQITFSIDMTGAVGTDNTIWVPGSAVFVNGPWPNWLPWNPLSLSGQQLTEVGSTPIYTGTVTIAAGNTTSLTYKYSLGGADNEAGQDLNLIRVIRTTATGAYSFPQDKWQNQYQEPSFGQLAVEPASGGNVALSWLGRPGCQVQTSPSLTSPSWVSYPNTDGTNWTVGTVSTNGLLSATNWPVSTGNLFFRLIKH